MKHFRTLFVLLLLSCSLNLYADSIAQVILAKGTVMAQSHDGEIHPLKRRSKLYNGDSITTAKNSSVQIRFIDKALMTIKSDSKFNISEYHLGDGTVKNKAFMKLLKGGFRTITGSIGKGDKKAYRVDTPAASIGIRGTNYEVQQESTGDFVVAVYSGGVTVHNSVGSIDLGFNSDYNFTRVQKNKPPKGLLIPPPSLADNSTTPSDESKTSVKNSESEKQTADGETLANNNDHLQNTAQNEAPTEAVVNSENEPAMAPYDHSPTEPLATNDPIPDPIELPEEFMPEPIETPSGLGIFDFNDPYNGITAMASPLPSAMNDMNYALAASGELGFMTMTAIYSPIPGQHANISSPEAGLSSPEAISSFSAYDFSSNQTYIKLCYEIIDINTGEVSVYEQKIDIDINITSLAQLQSHINDALSTGNVDINEVSSTNPGYVTLALNDSGDRLVFSANSADGEYITDMNMKFKNYGTSTSLALMDQMGSPNALPQDWVAQTSISLSIGSGAWDKNSNSPSMLLSSQVDDSGETIERTEVFYKPVIADETVNNLNSFFDCTSNNKICDIQVDNVAAADNIRWGAWLSEPTDPLQVHQQDTDSSGNVTDQLTTQDNTLNFWLAAQRADINQLSGSASFSGSANCSDFSQCMGIADDGMVQSINGQFDGNFNNGNISNGQLTVNTSAANSSIYDSGIAPLSTWQVNFDGQMTAGQPEFQSQNLSGTVNEGGTQITDKVVGNVGGIFVKPGDVFAGGYNLGTKGDSGKHTTGVFTLDKQP